MTGKICGTGSYAPETVWDNNRLKEMVDTSDEWIRERTGVVRRHIAGEQETTAYQAAMAGKAALEDAGSRAEEVELILAATTSPENLVPGTACQVQKLLGAGNATCFDVNGACAGFLFALNTAQAYIAQGIYRSVLVVGAETLSGMTDWTDRNTCILFGDGAGAALLRASEEGRFAQVTHSEGARGDVLTCACRNRRKECDGLIRMDGGEVFKFAVSRVPDAIRELLEREKVEAERISCYILHQANERIVRAVARRLGESMDKFPMNMQEYGNTSSASIPILLDEVNRQGRLRRGDYLVLSGFGGGLSYGASLLEW